MEEQTAMSNFFSQITPICPDARDKLCLSFHIPKAQKVIPATQKASIRIISDFEMHTQEQNAIIIIIASRSVAVLNASFKNGNEFSFLNTQPNY